MSSRAARLQYVIPADAMWCVYWGKTLARVAGLADFEWTGGGTLKCQLGVEPWLVRVSPETKGQEFDLGLVSWSIFWVVGRVWYPSLLLGSLALYSCSSAVRPWIVVLRDLE